VEANHVQVVNEHVHHDNIINKMEVEHMTIFDGNIVQGKMQLNESTNCHDHANDTMGINGILRMDVAKENQEDMMANMEKDIIMEETLGIMNLKRPQKYLYLKAPHQQTFV